ncbi:MAG: hypothetical protein ABJB55_01600 [Actinomycetota bacterium]
MTRYLCIDDSHRRDGKRVPVDLTDSVRLERSLVPRPSVYLAVTEDLIEHAISMPGTAADRRVGIERFLTGESEPTPLPVVLVSERSTGRPRGRYEWDDLRRDPSLLDRLAAGPAGDPRGAHAADDVIFLGDAVPETAGGTDLLRKVQPRLRVIPQGIFDLHELAAAIAVAGSSDASMIDAIRTAPHATVGDVVAETPWRVIVPCPVTETGEAMHLVMFTGLEGREPVVLYGTPAAGLDESVETTAPGDLFPAAELARAERGASLLVASELLIATAILLGAWASGALAVVAREHAVWLGVSLVLGISAVAFGLLPQFATRDPDTNPNDIFVARRSYADRISMFGWACAISAVLFGLSLVTGIGPALGTDAEPTSSASVTFHTATSPVLATIQVDVANATPDEAIAILVTSFASTDAPGVGVAQLSELATEVGTSETVQSLSMRPGDDFLAISVGTEQTAAPNCTPLTSQTAGCTVVAIPASDVAATPVGSGSTSAPVVPSTMPSPAPTP